MAFLSETPLKYKFVCIKCGKELFKKVDKCPLCGGKMKEYIKGVINKCQGE